MISYSKTWQVLNVSISRLKVFTLVCFQHINYKSIEEEMINWYTFTWSQILLIFSFVTFQYNGIDWFICECEWHVIQSFWVMHFKYLLSVCWYIFFFIHNKRFFLTSTREQFLFCYDKKLFILFIYPFHGRLK